MPSLTSQSFVRRLGAPLFLVLFAACAKDSGTGPSKPTTDGSYKIQLRYVGTAPTGNVAAAFENAVTRIQAVVTGDIPNAQIGTTSTPFDVSQCNASITGVTLNEVVDDIVIYAKVDSIDGVGQVLGSAGPCLTRTTGGLTGLGIMRFDTADLANLASNGRLGDVILHEMLHVIGIGTLWETRGLLAGKDSATVRVTGALAAAACANDLAGSSVCVGSVPAENCLNLAAGVTCGTGTQNSHWKESTFRTELMTGYAGTSNPMSKMTIQALADLGYTVNVNVADAYSVPPAALTAGVIAASTTATGPSLLFDAPVILPEPLRPRFSVDEVGRIRSLRR